MQQFTSSYFKRNRKMLRGLIDEGVPIVLTAHTQMQCTADMAYPFRQDTNFWYVTGCDTADVTYLFDGVKEYLILPQDNAIRDVFDGSIDLEKLKTTSGIAHVLDARDGAALLKKTITAHKKVATLPPMTPLQTHYGIAPNPARKQLISKIQRWQKGLEIVDIRLLFAELRMVKSAEEITAIEESITITAGAFRKAKKSLENCTYSYELEAIMTKHFRERNAKHAYSPIIAGGKDACILHYTENQSKLMPGSSVLLDVGAEATRGAADITRTYAVGQPPTLLKQIHAAVLEIQDYAFSLLKPGIFLQDYEKSVEKKTGEVLAEMGLIDQQTHEEIRRRFPHATSHYLGLDVHDIGDYSKPLPVGAVLTVEPGIYVPEKSIGVRIEDNILITETGYKNLSQNLSTAL